MISSTTEQTDSTKLGYRCQSCKKYCHETFCHDLQDELQHWKDKARHLAVQLVEQQVRGQCKHDTTIRALTMRLEHTEQMLKRAREERKDALFDLLTTAEDRDQAEVDNTEALIQLRELKL